MSDPTTDVTHEPAAGPTRVPAPRGAALTLTVDGRPVRAHEGETLVTALLAAGVTRFRTAPDGAPRAPFCHMGTCFECVVHADGRDVRACLAPAVEGTEVRTHDER